MYTSTWIWALSPYRGLQPASSALTVTLLPGFAVAGLSENSGGKHAGAIPDFEQAATAGQANPSTNNAAVARNRAP
ncbi:hypothetical protein [Arthrobacter sp. HLT1-20]